MQSIQLYNPDDDFVQKTDSKATLKYSRKLANELFETFGAEPPLSVTAFKETFLTNTDLKFHNEKKIGEYLESLVPSISCYPQILIDFLNEHKSTFDKANVWSKAITFFRSIHFFIADEFLLDPEDRFVFLLTLNHNRLLEEKGNPTFDPAYLHGYGTSHTLPIFFRTQQDIYSVFVFSFNEHLQNDFKLIPENKKTWKEFNESLNKPYIKPVLIEDATHLPTVLTQLVADYVGNHLRLQAAQLMKIFRNLGKKYPAFFSHFEITCNNYQTLLQAFTKDPIDRQALLSVEYKDINLTEAFSRLVAYSRWHYSLSNFFSYLLKITQADNRAHARAKQLITKTYKFTSLGKRPSWPTLYQKKDEHLESKLRESGITLNI